jgi:hypothetical protein
MSDWGRTEIVRQFGIPVGVLKLERLDALSSEQNSEWVWTLSDTDGSVIGSLANFNDVHIRNPKPNSRKSMEMMATVLLEVVTDPESPIREEFPEPVVEWATANTDALRDLIHEMRKPERDVGLSL